jgi:hypothetical protein
MKTGTILWIVVTMTALLSCNRQTVGIGAKPPLGAEVLFDGSRKMLDKKWIYCDQESLSGFQVACGIPR